MKLSEVEIFRKFYKIVVIEIKLLKLSKDFKGEGRGIFRLFQVSFKLLNFQSFWRFFLETLEEEINLRKSWKNIYEKCKNLGEFKFSKNLKKSKNNKKFQKILKKSLEKLKKILEKS